MKLRNSAKSKVALLTTLIFMLTLAFSMPPADAASLAPSVPGHIGTKGNHSFAIQTDGTLWAWGDNMDKYKLGIDPSQLSAEETKYSRVCSPKQVEWEGRQGRNVKYVAAGPADNAVILEDGECWLWGNNANGQLGDGSTTTRITPTVPLAGITDIASFALSGNSTVALKKDGTVWAWGYNSFGLGTGSTKVLTPAQVKGPDGEGYLENVKAIANLNAILALKEDGTVWGWGQNRYGQLGVEPSTNPTIPYPVQIEGLSDISAISVGILHCLALKKDGTVWAWGNGNFGQLGREIDSSYTPLKVEGLDNVVAIDAGLGYSLALKKDGTVWGCGKNDKGLLPGETAKQTSTPTQITGLSNIIEIAAGDNNYLALEQDGTLWGWGFNDKGQLGIGKVSPYDPTGGTHILPPVKSLMKLEPPLEAPMSVFLYPYASPNGPTSGIEVDRALQVGFVNPLNDAGIAKINEVKLNKVDAAGNKPVEITCTLKQDKLLTIQPADNLEYGADYELVIPAGIEDTAGNSACDESTVLFKTLSFEQPSYKITQGEQPVETLKPGEKYRLTAAVTNASVKARTVKAILQLRGGKGAMPEQGGEVLAQNSPIITVESKQSSEVILDFEVPADMVSPVIYGDILVWEEDCLNASAKPAHFSCPVVK